MQGVVATTLVLCGSWVKPSAGSNKNSVTNLTIYNWVTAPFFWWRAGASIPVHHKPGELRPSARSTSGCSHSEQWPRTGQAGINLDPGPLCDRMAGPREKPEPDPAQRAAVERIPADHQPGWQVDHPGLCEVLHNLGRKNYLFAGSHKAAQRAAMIYSFFSI